MKKLFVKQIKLQILNEFFMYLQSLRDILYSTRASSYTISVVKQVLFIFQHLIFLYEWYGIFIAFLVKYYHEYGTYSVIVHI